MMKKCPKCGKEFDPDLAPPTVEVSEDVDEFWEKKADSGAGYKLDGLLAQGYCWPCAATQVYIEERTPANIFLPWAICKPKDPFAS